MDNRSNAPPSPKKGSLPGSDIPSQQEDPIAPMHNGSSKHVGINNGHESIDVRGLQGGSYTEQQQQLHPPASYSSSGPPPPHHGGEYPSPPSGGYLPASSSYPLQQYQGGGYPPPSSGAPPEYGVYSSPEVPQQQHQYQYQHQHQHQQQHQGVYSPPGTAPPPSSICLPLINPRSISSGFTITMPEGLYLLARRPNAINKDMWVEFIRKLNEQLEKSPGSITRGITDHWIIALATLGVAGMARDMIKSKVQSKAMELVECYNRAEFASWGIRVLLDVLDTDEKAPVKYHSTHSIRRRFENRMNRRMERDERREERRASSSDDTLVLVISRSD
ncbi:hypothetical protein IW140_005662 [Coemansia sp. RSA 1813]|nr:hypothetical protein EV179_004364 [Coemansia sp. RSA 487]KAJ2564637.1 hypothetical protein IW140_005662 [Coemansia sp. RSA 1813]